MKIIAIEEFDQDYMSLIDQLDDEGLAIIKGGELVAELTKYGGNHGHLIGSLKHKIKVYGDIYSTGIHYPEDCHKYNRSENQPTN